jgi:hypothetical protein
VDWVVLGILEMSPLLLKPVAAEMGPVWSFPANLAPSKEFQAGVAREHWQCRPKVELNPAWVAPAADKVLDMAMGRAVDSLAKEVAPVKMAQAADQIQTHEREFLPTLGRAVLALALMELRQCRECPSKAETATS